MASDNNACLLESNFDNIRAAIAGGALYHPLVHSLPLALHRSSSLFTRPVLVLVHRTFIFRYSPLVPLGPVRLSALLNLLLSCYRFRYRLFVIVYYC